MSLMIERMSAPWLVSSIIVDVTSKKEWEYGAVDRLEQVFQRGDRGRQAVHLLNNRDFNIQLFASLFPHDCAELAHALNHL